MKGNERDKTRSGRYLYPTERAFAEPGPSHRPDERPPPGGPIKLQRYFYPTERLGPGTYVSPSQPCPAPPAQPDKPKGKRKPEKYIYPTERGRHEDKKDNDKSNEKKKDGTENAEARLCKACMDKDVNIRFSPCGHLATCETCAAKIDTCLVCRADIEERQKTYLT